MTKVSIQDKLEKRNIDEFVALARECFSSKFPNQDFDSSRWDYRHLAKSSTRNADRYLYFVRYQPRMTITSVLQAEALPAYYSSIVKSALLLHSNTANRTRLTAFRVLWEVLLERFGGSGSGFRWYLLRESDVRKAEERMKGVWADYTVYSSINFLTSDLHRLADRNIVARFDVVPETPCPKMTALRTIEGQESASSKLPTRPVLEGLADIYARYAVNAPDRLLADVVAILAFTGLRLDEVLTLSYDCLINRTFNGAKRIGLRISKRKSFHRAEEDHVLWLTPNQSAMVVAAIKEARTITRDARARAKELEQNPGTVTLPGINWSDDLSAWDVANLVGFVNSTVVSRISRKVLPRRRVGKKFVYSATDVGRYLQSRLKAPWTLRRADGSHQMLSESLFVIFKNYFYTVAEGPGSHRLIRLLVEPVTQQQVRRFLTGGVYSRSAFERFDIRDPQTGEVLRMNPHQCRHWIIHNAVRGGIPIREMARWHGREKGDSAHPYIHMTTTERLHWVKHKIESGTLQGPFIDYYFSLADDVKDLFLKGRLAAIHVTHMGLCLHDFTVMPCPKKLACLSGKGCREYVFDPSDQKQRTNLIQLTRRTSMAIEQAREKAKTPGLHFARSWIEDAENTCKNVETILSIAPQTQTLVRPFMGQSTKFNPIGSA